MIDPCVQLKCPKEEYMKKSHNFHIKDTHQNHSSSDLRAFGEKVAKKNASSVSLKQERLTKVQYDPVAC